MGRDTSVPLASETTRAPGWWGSVFLLVANGTFFGSLIFGYAFLWTVAPGWPPADWLVTSIGELGIGIGAVVLSALGQRFTIRRLRSNRSPWLGLTLALAATAIAIGVFVLLLLRLPDPTGHAYAATLVVLTCYALFHAGLVGIMQAFLAVRIRRGYVSARRCAEAHIISLWVDYLAVIGTMSLLAIHLPGLMV